MPRYLNRIDRDIERIGNFIAYKIGVPVLFFLAGVWVLHTILTMIGEGRG